MGGRKRGKHQCVVASCIPPTGDLAQNPGVCPDQDWTGDSLVPRPALNPLSLTSWGPVFIFDRHFAILPVEKVRVCQSACCSWANELGCYSCQGGFTWGNSTPISLVFMITNLDQVRNLTMKSPLLSGQQCFSVLHTDSLTVWVLFLCLIWLVLPLPSASSAMVQTTGPHLDLTLGIPYKWIVQTSEGYLH